MDITIQQLKEKIDNKEAINLIDVREDYEHEEFNVGGQLIPLGDLTHEVDNLEEKKGAEIIVYCRSGNRSAMAQEILEQNGFANVRNLEGGMNAWEETFGK